MHPLRAGIAESQSRILVVRDEVHLRRHTGEQIGEAARILVAVVDAPEQHVLEGDAAAVLHRELAARVDERRDVPLLVDRHQFRALLVRGRIQRHGQLDARLLSEPLDVGHEATGADGDVAVAEVRSVGMQEQVERPLHVHVIVQRLAHAHVDEIGQRPLRVHAGLAAQIRVHAIYLIGDLARGEITQQPHRRRHAEPAAHRAADLRRDAERAPDALARRLVVVLQRFGIEGIRPGFFGHVDRFDVLPVFRAQAVLARPIGGPLHGIDRQRRQVRFASEAIAERARQVRHFADRCDAAVVHPAEELLCAKGLLAHALDEHRRSSGRSCAADISAPSRALD